MKIPLDALSDEALAGIIEAFVLREGTDYGHRDFSLERKCAAVRRQLERGEARLVYDEDARSPNIVPADNLTGSTEAGQ